MSKAFQTKKMSDKRNK